MLNALRSEFSLARNWRRYSLALAIVLLTVGYGVHNTAHKEFPSNIAVYTQIMVTPFVILLPFASVALGCGAMFSAVGNRYVAGTRSRIDIRRFVLEKAVGAAVLPFVAFFLIAFSSFLISFYVWPLLGNPGVDPMGYGLSPSEADAAQLSDTSYSSLISFGLPTYGFLYSLWFGIGGASYSLIGLLALIRFSNRYVAVLVPFIVYFGETVLATVTAGPGAALMYSLVPFGLRQSPVLTAALPELVLMAAAALIWYSSARDLKRFDQLA